MSQSSWLISGIGLVSLTIDTTTPGSVLVFHAFGAIAQFERALILERTAAGLAEARRRGRKGGRPPAFKAGDITAARALMKEGKLPVRDVASAWGSRWPRSTATSAGRAPATIPRMLSPPMPDWSKRPPGEALVDLRRRLALLSARDPARNEVIARAAEAYGVSVWTIYRALRELTRPKSVRHSDH